MALFTDADIVTLDDLQEYETSLVQVSSSHSIDVETKIHLAIAAISDKLLLWLTKMGPGDPQWLQRRQLGLTTVVVSSTLQRWLCFESLARFYGEAYNVQLNTRFQGKWVEYQQLAGEAASMAFSSGLGLVANPLPKPAMPAATVGSGLQAAGPIFIQTAWIDSRGNEGALSPVNGVILAAGSSLSVAMADQAPPRAAVGWNLYAGTTADGASLQNHAPLALGAEWALPDSGLRTGAQPVGGQQPDYYVTLSREMQRG